MSNNNKAQKAKTNIYTSINDLILFKIANLELNYYYKKHDPLSVRTGITEEEKRKDNAEYEEKITKFFNREIVNYSCRLAPASSDSFWDEELEILKLNDFGESPKMMFRLGGNLRNSKIRVKDNKKNRISMAALNNLRKIEFFTMQTMIEAVEIKRSRNFDVIHSYLIETQKRLRKILNTILKYAIVDWKKEFRLNQPAIQKNLIIHLFHLDQLNLNKPELSLRIRLCKTKKQHPEKSDCKSPYFYASKLEENKYCSKNCKKNYENFQEVSPFSKKIKEKIKRRSLKSTNA
jgi:hypothetical protein